MTEKERLLHLLFEKEGTVHRDLKLMRNPADNVTEEALCAQISGAIVRRRTGKLLPRDVRATKKTNIDKFAAAL